MNEYTENMRVSVNKKSRHAVVVLLSLAMGGVGFVAGVAGLMPEEGFVSAKVVEPQPAQEGAPVHDGCPMRMAVLTGDVARLRQLLTEEVRPDVLNSLVLLAAEKGQADCLELLLSRPGVNPNEAADENEDGPLKLALAHPKCLELLLAVPGIDLNWVNADGCTTLDSALSTYNLGAVRQLLQHEGVDWKVVSPLLQPLLRGDADELQRMLQAGELPRANFGCPSLLHIAAALGDAACLRVLLQQPWVSVNSQDSESHNALYLAVSSGSMECVRLLIECAEVRTDVYNWYRNCPINRAVEIGRPDILELLLTELGGLGDADEAVYTTIQNGDMECFRVLLRTGVLDEMRSPDVLGETPLLKAAACGQAQMLSILLQQPEYRKRLPLRNHDGYSALMAAKKAGHDECVSLLLAAGADAGMDSRLPFDSHFWLEPAVVRGLLPSGCDWLQQRNEQGDTLLHIASRQGQAESLRHLLSLPGCDVSVIDAKGYPPLKYAVLAEYVDCVELLLAHWPESDISMLLDLFNMAAVNCEKRSLIEAFLKTPCVRRAMSESKGDMQALFSASLHEDSSNFDAMVALMRDPGSLRDFEGRSLLSYAVRYDELDAAKRVLALFPEHISVKDSYGCSVLHIAVTWDCCAELVGFLLSCEGVDVNAVDDSGCRPIDCLLSDLFIGDEREHTAEILQLLIGAGVDVNAPGVHGRTLLGSALLKGDHELVEQLLRMPEIDINRTDAHGYAAIHYAVILNNRDFLELLIETPGVNLMLQDKWGRTPVQLIRSTAPYSALVDVVSELADKGESIVQTGDINKLSAIIELDPGVEKRYELVGYAAEYGQVECLQRLLNTPDIPVNVPTDADGEFSLLQLALPHPVCVQILLAEQGIDVNYRNSGGYSALDMAAQLGYIDSLKLLLQHPEVLRSFVADTPNLEAIDRMAATPECREVLRAAYTQATCASDI